MQNKKYPYNEIPDIFNFREYLQQCENEYKTKVAFSFEKNKNIERRTYVDVYNEAKYFSMNFIKYKYYKEKIALMGENTYEWILIYFGVVVSNNIIVPIDKELSIEQIELILKETETKLFFCSNRYKDYMEKIKSDMPYINIINLDKEFKNMLNEGENEYLNNKENYIKIRIEPDDLATIIYTSGTTGIAKGVMLTHRNICMNCVGGRKNLKLRGSSVLVLPLHHTYAFVGSVLCTMGWGVEVYINNSLKRITQDMQNQKPYLMLLVPMILETFYKKIWNTAKQNRKDILLKICICISNFLLLCGIDIRRKLFKDVLKFFGGNLETIICGGAQLDPKYVKGFRNFGIQIVQGYGITECSPMLAVTRNYYYKDKSVGLKLPNMDIKIDKYGNSDEGEILAKGECVMKGYYNNAILTKEVFTEDGYFKTGDVGKIDKDGFVYITGRVKNIIILENGKNVYPEELEFELQKNDTIKEVLVYEKEGKIIAEIFPNEDIIKELEIEDIEEYYNEYIKKINKSLPIYKNINRIKIRNEEFPKTTTMKIKRLYK